MASKRHTEPLEYTLISRYHIWSLVIGKILHTVHSEIKRIDCYSELEFYTIITKIRETVDLLAKYQVIDGYLTKLVPINSNISSIIRKHIDEIEPKPINNELYIFIVMNILNLLMLELRISAYRSFYSVLEYNDIFVALKKLYRTSNKITEKIEQIYCSEIIHCNWDDEDLNKMIRTKIDHCVFDIIGELESNLLSITNMPIKSPHATIYTKEDIAKRIANVIMPVTLTGPIDVVAV